MLLLCSLLASASPADGEPVDDPAASAALAAADALVTEAHRLAERGDPHGKSRPGLRAAAMAYQVFIKDFPLSERGPDALLTAGVLLERLEQAVDINPDFAPALHRLAQHELRLYRLTEAAALLEVASEQAPDDPAIAADLAIARQRVR